MMWLVLTALGLAVVAIGLWCAWTATRLDRLHLQLQSARAGLAEALMRRSAAATDLALSASLDPASSLVLADAATAAREPTSEDWQAQSEFSTVLRMVRESLTESAAPDGELDRSCRGVAISRRIHNDIAVRAQELHRRRRVRWLRLAGHAGWPETIEFDALDDLG